MGLFAVAASAQDTVFTFQGNLNQNGSPANGVVNFDFTLFSVPSGGTMIGTPNVRNGIPVVDGKFSVELNFGAAAFEENRWLQIKVNGIALSPRTPISHAPYAIQTRGIFVADGYNVGIGTSLPDQKLSVVSDDAAIAGYAESAAGDTVGVYGRTVTIDAGVGVLGETSDVNEDPNAGTHYFRYGIKGLGTGGASFGVWGDSIDGHVGVWGTHRNSPTGPTWTLASGGIEGVIGSSEIGTGVVGIGTTGIEGRSISPNGRGVLGMGGYSGDTAGGFFLSNSPNGYGVRGYTSSTGTSPALPAGVLGKGGVGVRGESEEVDGTAVVGIADNGTFAWAVYGQAIDGYAGYFSGKVQVLGNLNVTGTKNFLIDHPLDPENLYLAHAVVESDQPLNSYSGNTVLDNAGRAQITLPDWFDAVNTDFRYQLTAIGAPAPMLHVESEIQDNAFHIAGGPPGLKVSWNVTARRNDPYLQTHPFEVETAKPEHERGTYLAPEAYNQPPEKSVVLAKSRLPREDKPSAESLNLLRSVPQVIQVDAMGHIKQLEPQK
jgi:hypothetical protein